MSDLIQSINVGDIIAERYEVKEVMGRSELGLTCLVQSPRTHENFLVKQLSFPCDEAKTEEINQFIAPLRRIEHRSISSLKDFVVENGVGYVVMEYIDGETLESHLASRRERGQILGLKAAYSFLANLCIGLDLVHQAGYAYGCINPHTIFVTKQGRIRIANYACAAIAERYLPDAQRNTYFGGPFAAPEVKAARFQAKPPSDVYSLGLLFAELLSTTSLSEYTGSNETFVASIPGVTTSVKELLFQAIQTEMGERFKTAQAFKDTLKRAIDAPGDSDLSSIVVGVNDLRALSVSADMPVIDPAMVRKPDLFDTDSEKTPSRNIKPEVWIFQKDGMDYGPFDHDALIQKFYDEVITESTSVFNTSTKARQNLGSIPEFEKEVIDYLPLREKNRAQRLAEQKKKEKRIKAGGFSAALIIVGAVAAVLLIPVIILALKPAPEALDFIGAFKPFEKRFEVPKVEEMSLNVDDSQAKALFDPKATEAEREAAYAKWEAEHRKKYAGMRRTKGGKAGVNGGLGEEIDTIVFTGEDGEELEPLQDWEIEEQCMSPRIYRKYNECFVNYAGGRHMNVTISFTIQQSGVVRNFSTTTSGELNDCLISALSSIKFRQFGGMTKKVKLPVSY